MLMFGNLFKSRHISRYFSLSRHTGSLQNPPHEVAANVTGRFTEDVSQPQIGGRF